MKLTTGILELEAISEKTLSDYKLLPDDGSEFPNLTPMKRLKLSFQNVANSTSGLANVLKQIKETGTIV